MVPSAGVTRCLVPLLPINALTPVQANLLVVTAARVPGLHFSLGQGVKRQLTWKRLAVQHVVRQEDAGAPRVLLAAALKAALV